MVVIHSRKVMKINIELLDRNNMMSIVPLLNELYSSIPEEVLKSRVQEMVSLGYECAGIYSNENLIGICGLWTSCKPRIGKYIVPDNIYIKREYINIDLDIKLNLWLKELSVTRGCVVQDLKY